MALDSACAAIGVGVNGEQGDLFWRHFELVVETNRRFNLTRITEPADAAVKHYADALTLLAMPLSSDAGIRLVVDVGTGAGFPAFPLAVMKPEWRITAMDSTGKKAAFVEETAARLGISNLTGQHHRAGEKMAEPARYDLVLYRAVAQLSECLRTAKDLVRPGGYVVGYQSDPIPKAELREARTAAKRGGFHPHDGYAFVLPLGGEPIPRRLVTFRKVDPRKG